MANKPYKAILFDLDGTLLPMDNDFFIIKYLELLSDEMKDHGYEKKNLINAVWNGVGAAIKNPGEFSNEKVFWNVFSKLLEKDPYSDIEHFNRFYTEGFNEARRFTSPTKLSVKAVALAREKADRVILATNPVFPAVAVKTRLSWAGLSFEDFDLVTTYENSYACKPNPKYYKNILAQFGLDPCDCLMIGNNSEEDEGAASMAGLETYLVTDCLIGTVTPSLPNGSLEDLIEFLESK